MLNKRNRYPSIPSGSIININIISTKNIKSKSKLHTYIHFPCFISLFLLLSSFYCSISLQVEERFLQAQEVPIWSWVWKITLHNPHKVSGGQQFCLSSCRIRTYSFLSFILIERNVSSDGSVLFMTWRQHNFSSYLCTLPSDHLNK